MSYIVDILFIFFIYAFIGWCIEVILKYRQFGRFINRGFLAGPWLPIYGAGASLITISVGIVQDVDKGFGTTFVMSFIVCGFIEYMASYIMEKRFHARWWDYSQKPMNLNGRIWMGNLVLFGLGGVAIIHIANPIIYGFINIINPTVKMILISTLVCIFIADYVMSHFVLKLVKIGVEQSDADNTEAIQKDIKVLFSDKSIFYRRFADAYPDVIYRTEKVKERMEKVRIETERIRIEAERRIDNINNQLEENKELWKNTMEASMVQFSANVEAGKEILKSNMEPTNQIRANIIDKQWELIQLIYNEETASSEERVLKDEIEHERARLDKRLF